MGIKYASPQPAALTALGQADHESALRWALEQDGVAIVLDGVFSAAEVGGPCPACWSCASVRPASTTGKIPSCLPMAVRRAGVACPRCSGAERLDCVRPLPLDIDAGRDGRLPPAGQLELRDTVTVGGELVRTADSKRVTADPAGHAVNGRYSAPHDRTDAVGAQRTGAGVGAAADLVKRRPCNMPGCLEVTLHGCEHSRPDLSIAAFAVLIGSRRADQNGAAAGGVRFHIAAPERR